MSRPLPLSLPLPPAPATHQAKPTARAHHKSTRLWAAIDLPALPLEALGERADSAQPIAVIEGNTSRAPLVALSAGAQAAGLYPGMAASAAGARVDNLSLRTRDPARETVLLDRLAAWSQRFTSVVSQEPPAALLLEIGGSLKLFGGIEALRQRIKAELEAEGYAAQLALAPTPRAALWLARAGMEIGDARGLAGQLGTLPLATLRLPERTAQDFERLGARTLREVFRLPRDGLARRFGPALLRDWDRALGQLPEARRQWQAEHHFAAERELPIALHETGRLEAFINELIAELATALRRHDAGIDSLTLVFEHSRLPPTRIRLRLLAASRDPAHLQRLVHTRLERLHLPAAAVAVSLHSGFFKPMIPPVVSLIETRPEPSAERPALVETLRARLGRDAVCGLMPAADPRPEHTWQRVEPGPRASEAIWPRRPIWLLQKPRPLSERPRLISGPERIEAGWWSEGALDRDYYIARTPVGARWWVYREQRSEQWFLHGYFA